MSKKRKVIVMTLLLFIVGCIGYIGYFFYQNYIIPSSEDSKNQELREEYNIEQEESTQAKEKVKFEYNEFGVLEKTGASSSQADASQKETTDNTEHKSLDKVKEQNKNVLAWIYVKDTTIDYPVVQSKTDNSFYLDRDINGYYSVNGSIFLDTKVDLNTSQNIVVYGHRMDADYMFHSLERFKDEKFGVKHDVYFDIGDNGSRYWEVAGVFYCPESEGRQFTFTTFTRDTIKDFIKQVKEKRIYDTPVELSENDQYLTLITCSYEGTNYRTIVVCRRRQ